MLDRTEWVAGTFATVSTFALRWEEMIWGRIKNPLTYHFRIVIEKFGSNHVWHEMNDIYYNFTVCFSLHSN